MDLSSLDLTFVEFEKTFDYVNRKYLWERVIEIEKLRIDEDWDQNPRPKSDSLPSNF